MLPANGRLGWKGITWYKRSSLLGHGVSYEKKTSATLTPTENDPTMNDFMKNLKPIMTEAKKTFLRFNLCISVLS
jgi:hypothetical protein